ncbi:MAG TPA: DUF6130 family protein [Vicinamibacterales bacterium]
MPVTRDLVTSWRGPLTLGLLVIGVIASACGGAESPPAQPASEPPAAAAPPAAASAPRVYWVEPVEGAMVKSPVKLVFGIENYELAAVPQGTVTASRPNLGHHHVGVDIDCLPPGTEIPKANPWVHHGSGATTMDMQLPPGPHKLTLQLGDDLHKTIEGLCQTINITVVQ